MCLTFSISGKEVKDTFIRQNKAQYVTSTFTNMVQWSHPLSKPIVYYIYQEGHDLFTFIP